MPKRFIRPVRIEGQLAYVPLTRGREAVIDACDAHFIGQWNWYAKFKPNTTYAVRQNYSSGTQKTMFMHREILQPGDDLVTDHEDGDGLNNRRSNLRAATPAQNCQNGKRPSNNTSGYKGVHWVSTHGKWRASIRHEKTRTFLGYFNCTTSAAVAYEKASKSMHGAFSTDRI